MNQPNKSGQKLVQVYGAKIVRLGLSVRTWKFARNECDTTLDIEPR